MPFINKDQVVLFKAINRNCLYLALLHKFVNIDDKNLVFSG